MANPAVGAGMTLAVTVGLFAYGGFWLDQQFGTKPWLMLLLVLTGIVGGMLHLIRVVAPEMWPFGDLKEAEANAKAQQKAKAAQKAKVEQQAKTEQVEASNPVDTSSS